MSTAATRFVEESVRLLAEVHLPRLRRAVELLPPEDLFWRPAPGQISVGTVLLHLDGNLRAWILDRMGDIPFDRDRDAEFAATAAPDDLDTAQLLRDLESTVADACSVVRALDEQRLLSVGAFQTGPQDHLQALYHVVEHFAYHTGQAVWIAKMRAARG